MSEYPEHDKMAAVREKSQAIGEFIEWMRETQEIVFGYYDDDGRLYPTHFTIETALADFFEIDLSEIERERRRMLASQRNLNEMAS